MILLIAAAGIANTILMSGFERKGEIGMMLAMGMPSRKIISLFAIEAAFIGFFGSILGGLIGVSGSLYFQENGIDLTASTQMMEGSASTIAYATTLYFELYPWVPVVGMFLGTSIAVIAALYPAYKVTQLEPREILAGG
jgi:ABC-type lipoprotein release transport system permease subunit